MLNRLRRAGLMAAALLVVVSSACGTEPTSAPSTLTPPAASQELLGGLVGGVVGTLTNTLGLTANGVLRTTPLPAAITVRKTIGRTGGVLSVPGSGLTVVVPFGALDRDTEITVTARAGSLLAYDFAPHGVTFRLPLTFNQSLKGTNVGLLSPLSLKLGYYTDPGLLGKTTAVVSEVIVGLTSVLTRTFTAPIKHFSGYIVITGFNDEGY